MKNTTFRLATAMALCLPGLALAQTDPAPASALRFESAFADYKPWADVSPADWRTVNETVRSKAGAGAHSGHSAPAVPASATQGKPAPPPAATTGEPGHSGHQMHGGQK